MTAGQQNKLLIFAAFFAIYIVWGTTYLAIKYAVESIPPYLVMGMRSLSAGAVLYIWGRLRGDANPSLKELPPLIFIGFLFFLVGHGGLAWAEQKVPSGVAALLITTETIFIAISEPLFTGTGRVSKRTLSGMLIGMTGVAVLVIHQRSGYENTSLAGTVVILVCAASWSAGAIYSRVIKLPRSPFITGGLQLLSGGLMLMLASDISGEWSGFSFSTVTGKSWAGLVYLVLFGSIIAFSAYTWLLTTTTATRISTHSFINPVVAVIVGWAFGSEALTMEILFATLLIVISVWLVLFRKTGINPDRS